MQYRINFNQQEPMYEPLNYVIETLSKGIKIKPVDHDSVDSLKKITSIYKETGEVHVSRDNNDNTIYGDPVTNIKFRGWHDKIHIENQYDFTPEGEIAAMEVQQQQATELLRKEGYNDNVIDTVNRLLEAEIRGQVEYYIINKHFVEDQREFTKNYFKQKGWEL